MCEKLWGNGDMLTCSQDSKNKTEIPNNVKELEKEYPFYPREGLFE